MNFSKTVILIPTINEKNNLEILLPEIFKFMPGISVLIVDDGSDDGTAELVNNLRKNNPSLFIMERTAMFGYGMATLDGFKWILERHYDAVVTMDADFSHDFHSIPALLKGLESNDVVIGSRYVNNGSIRNWELKRRILSKFANIYVRFILGLPIRDVTTGFNAYRTSSLKKLDFREIRSNGYAFLVELKFKLFRLGLKVSEYPIIFSERREGESKMSTEVIWESVWLPWRIRLLR